MVPHSSTLAWKIHGWRNLVGCSPWGHEESDTTEQLTLPSLLASLGLEWMTLSSRRRHWQPTSVLLPGISHGRRSLVGCSPWGHEESDKTEKLHFHFSLSCIGEGNGNPLQCSRLENPMDGGAWWAAIYGVAQSRTWLKRLSSNSSSSPVATAEFSKFAHTLSAAL